jgi:prolyl oligopeptidase
MTCLFHCPPQARRELVTEVLHGTSITDPYRWLEDAFLPETRAWLAAQDEYMRSYMAGINGRAAIAERVRQFLDIETSDSILKAGGRYVFRKRLAGTEQPCLYFRKGFYGSDQLLLNPAERGTGTYTAIRPLQISPDGRLLLYEVKQGGEKSGSYELFDLDHRRALPDALPHGYLRGFAFASDSSGFFYVHESMAGDKHDGHIVQWHRLGTDLNDDMEVYSTARERSLQLRIVPGENRLGILEYRVAKVIHTSFYLFHPTLSAIERVIGAVTFRFEPLLSQDRILALTNQNAPTLRIVEVVRNQQTDPVFVDVVPADDAVIRSWAVTKGRIYVSYAHGGQMRIDQFDPRGQKVGSISSQAHETLRITGASNDADELFFERESFTEPIATFLCERPEKPPQLWAKRSVPFDPVSYGEMRVSYPAKDGTMVPMYLVGSREVLAGGCHPAVMTSYGGYGVPVTPQFSVLVACLLERGCLFALPAIRGGSDLGSDWNRAAKRQQRQVAIDDFLAAAEWLIAAGRSEASRLAIFGGSNSGLLVGAALTQRPELFRAALCLAPLLDMLRYHHFDTAHLWTEEFGTAEDPEDFRALHAYSPYHRVRDGVRYPATLIVSGDADQSCNPLHARKMTARLQAANASEQPILLDYSVHRGHVPVLPLHHRVEALANRLAFLCDQLGLQPELRRSA